MDGGNAGRRILMYRDIRNAGVAGALTCQTTPAFDASLHVRNAGTVFGETTAPICLSAMQIEKS